MTDTTRQRTFTADDYLEAVFKREREAQALDRCADEELRNKAKLLRYDAAMLQHAADLAREREQLQAEIDRLSIPGYEWVSIEVRQHLLKVCDELERAKSILTDLHAWATAPERNLGFRAAQQEVLVMIKRGEGK